MITVVQRPSGFTPAYNEIVYIMTSDNVAQTNFRYVVDVYAGAAMVNRKIIPPNPDNDSGFVDISSIIQQEIEPDVDKSVTDNGITDTPSNAFPYTLKFGEQYGSSGTIYADLLTIGAEYVFNSVYDYLDFVDYSSGDIIASSSSIPFLTNRPTSGDIYSDDNAWLYWIRFQPFDEARVRVITYDSSNNVIDTRKVESPIVAYAERIPSGPNNLNDISNAEIISGGNQPIITASVAKYSLQVIDSSDIPLTQAYYYTIATNCEEYDKINVVFLNKLGGYDSFAFIKASRQTSQIERKEFKSSMGSFASATSFSYSKSDRAITNYHNKIKDTHTIDSDWITEAQSTWLEELITSTDVYVDNGTELIPIVVLNGNYERKKGINEKLFNLRLEYKYSFERYRQRR